jgi:hypothetical protein
MVVMGEAGSISLGLSKGRRRARDSTALPCVFSCQALSRLALSSTLSRLVSPCLVLSHVISSCLVSSRLALVVLSRLVLSPVSSCLLAYLVSSHLCLLLGYGTTPKLPFPTLRRRWYLFFLPTSLLLIVGGEETTTHARPPLQSGIVCVLGDHKTATTPPATRQSQSKAR